MKPIAEASAIHRAPNSADPAETVVAMTTSGVILRPLRSI